MTPEWEWGHPYQRHIQAVLDDVTYGRTRKVILSVPPRHGKSEMVTVRYLAYRIHRDPTTKVVIAACDQDLANNFSRKVRRIMEGRVALNQDKLSAEEWETQDGGGLRAAGVGGSIVGRGFRVLVIDDPIKSREQAESETYRNKVWDWYTDDLYTRRDPPEKAAIILITTRWHENDLAGRILMSETAPEWTVINFPALAGPDDMLGRKEGEALCPSRISREILLDIQRTQSAYSFNALYQGNPIPHEGNLFKTSQIQIVDQLPARVNFRARGWDKASGDGQGDYTAGVKMSEFDGYWYVEDVVRGRWDTAERDKVIRQTAELDGRDCRIWGEQEPGSGGKDSARSFVRLLAGFGVQVDKSASSKVNRAGGINAADGFSAQVNAGNVKMLKAAWNKAFLAELQAFPSGTYDDQVDAACGVFNYLARFGRIKVLSKGKAY